MPDLVKHLNHPKILYNKLRKYYYHFDITQESGGKKKKVTLISCGVYSCSSWYEG